MQNAMQSQQVIEMQGDIPSLCLHSSFFVEGVCIGWPFPVIMPPQRQVHESTDETHQTVLSGDKDSIDRQQLHALIR